MLDSGVGVGNAPRACEAQRSTDAAGNAERIRSRRIRNATADACKQLEALAGGLVAMYESPRSEYIGDASSRGCILHGSVIEDDDSHILSIDSRNDLAAELAAELRRVAKIHTDLADQVEGKARGQAAAAAHRQAQAPLTADLAATRERSADNSPAFTVLLCDAGQWEIVYGCDSRAEANAWVEEWEKDDCGMVAIVWPTRFPLNLFMGKVGELCSC